jgi:hypothetical protein
MARAGQRKCLNCGLYFDPDRRVGKRQRYCSAAPCRSASKAASAQRWLLKPQNRDYFRGPIHVARVRAWRAAHPGYARQGLSGRALQDQCAQQELDFAGQNANDTATPLQHLLEPVSPVLAGLIAHLFQVTLQDEMAATARRLVQLGTDVLSANRGVREQASAGAEAAAQRAAAVQLD